MTIRDEASAALAQREADEAAAEQAARDELRAGAVQALRGVLATADGTPAVALSTLTIEQVDLDDRLVVVTDPASTPPVSLAVTDRDDDGTYRVHLVATVDGEWTRLAGPLADLAAVGAALADREG